MAKKGLPFNIEAEKAVLGAMLLDSLSASTVLGTLLEEEFYDPKHKMIFNAMANIKNSNAIDVQTVTSELLNCKKLELVGGVAYLLELTDSVINSHNIDFYVQIIQDQAVLRNILLTMKEVDRKYCEEEIPSVSNFVADAQLAINKAAEKRRISSFVGGGRLADLVKSKIERQLASSSDNGVTGVDTGYTKLNALTHGLQKGDMIVLAARPSVGKTALALNIGFNASLKDNVPVAIFSLEMRTDQLLERLVANRACVSLDCIQTGRVSKTDRVKLNDAIEEIRKSSLYIDDSPGITMLDIGAKCKKLQAEKPDLGLIIIDYLGLIGVGGKKSDSRQDEVRQISSYLKGLGKELKVPILLLCQLSRKVEDTDGNVPKLSHLRESGAIEQDADIVILLHREDYQKNSLTDKYSKKQNRGSGNDSFNEQNNDKNSALDEIKKTYGNDTSLVNAIVAKNRNGKTETVRLLFFKNYGRFDNPSTAAEERFAKFYGE